MLDTLTLAVNANADGLGGAAKAPLAESGLTRQAAHIAKQHPPAHEHVAKPHGSLSLAAVVIWRSSRVDRVEIVGRQRGLPEPADRCVLAALWLPKFEHAARRMGGEVVLDAGKHPSPFVLQLFGVVGMQRHEQADSGCRNERNGTPTSAERVCRRSLCEMPDADYARVRLFCDARKLCGDSADARVFVAVGEFVEGGGERINDHQSGLALRDDGLKQMGICGELRWPSVATNVNCVEHEDPGRIAAKRIEPWADRIRQPVLVSQKDDVARLPRAAT